MATIADKHQCATAEIPQDQAEGFQPLDSEHHVVGAQCETIAVDVEDLVMHRHLHCVVAPLAREVVAVGDRHVKTSPAREHDTHLHRFYI
jgi:hypothetical protein